MLEASRVIDLAERRALELGQHLVVFWLCVDQGNRTELARAIQESRGDRWVVPLVPNKRSLFGDPNVVISNLLWLFVQHRERFEEIRRVTVEPRTMIVLVLSRVDCDLPVAPSPITLPAWFPVHAGCEIPLQVESLDRRARVAPLNSEEMLLDEIRQRLFRLDCLLHERLLLAHVQRKGAFESLWAPLSLKRTPEAHLKEWKEYLASITTPTAYRPAGGRDPRSFLAAIVALTARSSPDQVVAHGASLDTALALPHDGGGSLFSIMYRSPSVKGSVGTGAGVMMTSFISYQLINAGAHAGDYPMFPVRLIEAVGAEVRHALGTILTTIAH